MSKHYKHFRFTSLSTLLFFLINVFPLFGQENQKPLVVATASMFADMAETIGGNLIEVKTIVPIGGDPHMYEPTPGDARLAASADLVLRNGLTFEGWINELIENTGTDASIVRITQGVDAIESEDYANSSDPHAWMDASNGLIYIRNIKDALVKLAPAYTKEFEFNYEIYRQQIEDLDAFIAQEIHKIPKEKRILITSHDAFRYYGKGYGIQVEAVMGTSTDADIQVSDIVHLNDVLRSTGVPAVFIESTVNPKVLRQIAMDNNIVIGGSLYADSLGDKDSPASTYIDMMRYNTNLIVKGLTRQITDELLADTHRHDDQNNYWLFAIIIAIMAGSFFYMVFRLNQTT